MLEKTRLANTAWPGPSSSTSSDIDAFTIQWWARDPARALPEPLREQDRDDQLWDWSERVEPPGPPASYRHHKRGAVSLGPSGGVQRIEAKDVVTLNLEEGTVGFFMSQLGQLLGTGTDPATFKFGVILSAIFVFALTILETGHRR